MRHLIRWLLAVVTAAAVAASAAQAHHSFSAEFTDDEIATIEGEVTRVVWRNPHVRYEVAVTDENGRATVWELQTNATTGLQATGWTRESIELGDRIKVEGSRARSGAPKLYVRWVELSDGTVLAQRGPRVQQRAPVVYETSEPFRPTARPILWISPGRGTTPTASA